MAAGVGTRGSRLARAQTGWVLERLRHLAPDRGWEPVVVTTTGDVSAAMPRGTGVFVKELQQALLDGAIDLAVHSLKDLPTDPVPGLTVAAIPQRADPREALVGARLGDLAAGARVGTGSPRRSAQLRRLRPDLDVVPIRGNVPTRIEKVHAGEVDAVMVAAAGLGRLGIAADWLFDPEVVLPAPGQGALAVEAREGSPDAELLAALDDPATRAAVLAERAVLRELGGGCMLPVATYGRLRAGTLLVEGSVISPDGARQAWARAEGDPAFPADLGARVAKDLVTLGALDILDEAVGDGAARGA
jgi:hydroxymethylbilane synthase